MDKITNNQSFIILSPSDRLKKVSECATVEIDPNVPPKRYYESGLEMVRMANVYLEEGQLENAYVLYMKFMVLFLEKMRTHPSLNTVSQSEKAINQQKLRDVLPKAEQLKQRLLKLYEEEYKRYLQDEWGKMSALEQMGNQAYQKAMWNDFRGAIAILDTAIKRYPRDCRLYNNRSYCYCKLKDYKNALLDAEFMIKEFPKFPKGYYRKVDVFMDLKKYNEAESVLNELIKIDGSCDEAKEHLRDLQITILCINNKYWVTDAIKALELTNYNTAQAKAFLDVGGLKNARNYRKDEIYYSDPEDEDELPAATARLTLSTASKASSDDGEYDPYSDPSNPFKCNSVWVGNVTKKITEESIKPIFAKYGKIKSIIVQHQNYCAFVNYADHQGATTAMKKFTQHLPMEDTYLVIRFPDNAGNKVVPAAKKSGKK